MKNDEIYKFLYMKRKGGDDSFFTAGEIADEVEISNNGNLFRRMNKLSVIYEVLEVKIDPKRLCRKYRIKTEELKC